MVNNFQCGYEKPIYAKLEVNSRQLVGSHQCQVCTCMYTQCMCYNLKMFVWVATSNIASVLILCGYILCGVGACLCR